MPDFLLIPDMLKHVEFIAIVLLLLATSLSAGSQSPDKILLPKISLVYLQGGTPFDRECGSLLEKPIQEEWVQETTNRLIEFQALWDNEGTAYMQTALEEVGVPFPYPEMQATLTVCDFSSMSSADHIR